MVCAIYCNLVSFIVRARFGKFVDASADIDAPMQESKQGTVVNRNHILWSVLYYIETWLVLSYVLDLRRLYSNSVSYRMTRLIVMHQCRGANKEPC